MGPVSVQLCLALLPRTRIHGQIIVDPTNAPPVFGYLSERGRTVDLEVRFGWRRSPFISGLNAAMHEHAHHHTTVEHAAVSPSGERSA